MRKFLSYLRRRFFSDRADSILVPALILIPTLVLVVGIAVEVQKNNYIRTDRANAIQDAASSAVTLSDSRGSLNWKVVDRIVNEYEHNRFGKRVFSATANTRLNYDDDTRESSESSVFGAGSTEAESCLVGTGADEGQRYPQYRITLDESRGEVTPGAPTVSFTRTQPTTLQLNQQAPLDQSKVYRAVRIEVIDQAPNLIMGMVGRSCQKFDLSANAVTFAADADLR